MTKPRSYYESQGRWFDSPTGHSWYYADDTIWRCLEHGLGACKFCHGRPEMPPSEDRTRPVPDNLAPTEAPRRRRTEPLRVDPGSVLKARDKSGGTSDLVTEDSGAVPMEPRAAAAAAPRVHRSHGDSPRPTHLERDGQPHFGPNATLQYLLDEPIQLALEGLGYAGLGTSFTVETGRTIAEFLSAFPVGYEPWPTGDELSEARAAAQDALGLLEDPRLTDAPGNPLADDFVALATQTCVLVRGKISLELTDYVRRLSEEAGMPDPERSFREHWDTYGSVLDFDWTQAWRQTLTMPDGETLMVVNAIVDETIDDGWILGRVSAYRDERRRIRFGLAADVIISEEQRQATGLAAIPTFDAPNGYYFDLARAMTAFNLVGGVEDAVRDAIDQPDDLLQALRVIFWPFTAEEMERAHSEGLRDFVTEELAPFRSQHPNLHDEREVRLPEPRMVRGHEEAEEYAAEVLAELGFTGLVRTPTGPDGGVDVEGDAVVVQVKMEGKPTGRDRVQALYGIAAVEDKVGVFLSLAGYTDQAVAWADRAGVALLGFGADGSIEAHNENGRRLLVDGSAWDGGVRRRG